MLLVADVDMNTESVHFRDKGAKERPGRSVGTCARGATTGRRVAESVAGRPGRGTLNSRWTTRSTRRSATRRTRAAADRSRLDLEP
ncbi:hypothetical protein GCM10023170_087140 [Phytohabitans houttuyneae]|uniref:Uncharacterized protein n=1 Tax=Phytohabitans houttuyneae TaxID=1076126 RepID=A0A6V8K398_9ACTN|nr:hypothetical protein Phou_006260 [Phytohabitans houttuyneae]